MYSYPARTPSKSVSAQSNATTNTPVSITRQQPAPVLVNQTLQFTKLTERILTPMSSTKTAVLQQQVLQVQTKSEAPTISQTTSTTSAVNKIIDVLRRKSNEDKATYQMVLTKWQSASPTKYAEKFVFNPREFENVLELVANELEKPFVNRSSWRELDDLSENKVAYMPLRYIIYLLKPELEGVINLQDYLKLLRQLGMPANASESDIKVMKNMQKTSSNSIHIKDMDLSYLEEKSNIEKKNSLSTLSEHVIKEVSATLNAMILRPGTRDDAKHIAGVLDINLKSLTFLQKFQLFNFLSHDMSQHETERAEVLKILLDYIQDNEIRRWFPMECDVLDMLS